MKLIIKSLAFCHHRLTVATWGRVAGKNPFTPEPVPMENYGLQKIAGKFSLRFKSGSPRDRTLI